MLQKLLLSALATLVLCGLSEHPIEHPAAWLTGTWENKTPRGSVYEQWTQKNRHELLGKSFGINGKDTVVFETTRLVHERDSLFYIPTVQNQNGGKPVRFGMKFLPGAELDFKNEAHDFPQRIVYKKITEDSLVAEISGMRNGQLRSIRFPMKRIR